MALREKINLKGVMVEKMCSKTKKSISKQDKRLTLR